MRITDECTACGLCLTVCPYEAISEGDIYVINPDKCNDCGFCIEVCFVDCIEEIKIKKLLVK